MTPASDSVRRWHSALNLLAQSAVLVAFAFIQTPRLIAPDTKLDLTVNPGGLIARALTLWESQAASGQLQNQAYGYLFPMGPFFWLGHAVDVPEWVVQRLWWATLLLLGFHGMRLVLDRLEVGTPVSRMVGAFAYALAPRMVIGLGAVSSEIWPMAIAPWVLLPLLRVAPGAERTAASRSGVAFLMAGSVNAVATLALLPLPALWILSRASRRLRLGLWWVVSIGLVSLWWIGPLVLLGRFSPPFLDWIESSSVTTSGASLAEALRGTTQWIAGLTGARGAQWPAGWEILTLAPSVGLGLGLAVLGLMGLWAAPPPWRLFARLGLVGGLLLVTLGHVASAVGPQAELFAGLLDGPLSPFRNTHKFEPIVRVVLCLGLAHALPVVERAIRSLGGRLPRIALFIAIAAVGAQVAPAVFMGVAQRGSFIEVPGYWKQAADWLAAHPSSGRTLVLPGASAPASYWGDPRDEPLQPLARSPWMVRDAVPLGSASATRILNDIETRVASGYGGQELRSELRRLGVSRVLQRSDLNYRATGAPAPMVVAAALSSAGARPVQSFGPEVGGSPSAEVVIDGGREQSIPAIVVYDLAESSSIRPAGSSAPSDTVRVSGGPEAVALLPGAYGTAVLSSDTESVRHAGLGDASEVLTDTLQRREANFAAVRQNYGPVLGADEPYAASRGSHDWLMPWLTEDDRLARWQTVRTLTGASSVTATSSLAAPALGQVRDLAKVPASAFDASADTMWASSGFKPEGQSITVEWPEPVAVPAVVSSIFDMDAGADVGAVTITTEQGSARTPISSPSVTGADSARYQVALNAPEGPSRFLRLTVTDVRPGRPTVRIRDLGAGSLPRVESWLELPQPSTGRVAAVLLQASPSRTPACVPDGWGVPHCVPGEARTAEDETDLRRVFTLPTTTEFAAVGSVLPRDSDAVRSLLVRPDGVRAQVSSTWLKGASTAPELLLDGDDKTYWASDPGESQPTVTLRFPEPRRVTGLTLSTFESVSGRRPVTVEVRIGERTYRRAVGADGRVTLPERRTTTMTIRVVEATKLSFRTLAGPTPAPVVIGDIAVEGEAWDTVDQSGVAVPCGFGPRLQVNGTEYPTRVSGTRSALVNGQPLDLEVCGPVQLGAGTQRLRLLASTEFAVRSLSLRAPDEAGAGTSSGAQPGAAVSVERWNPTSRAVRVERSDRPQLVVVRENANPGWRAEAAGRRLEAVTADGWSQGWVVPAGTSGEVTMEFTPQTPFRVALLLGLLGALLAVWFARPRARLANAPVLREGSPPGWVHGVATLAAGSLLAGMWGLAAAALALVVTVVAPRRGVVMALVAGGIGLVGWSMVAPWPRPAATNRDVVSQLLACLLVALVVASPLRALWGRRERQALRRSERERSVGSDAPPSASSPLRSAR